MCIQQQMLEDHKVCEVTSRSAAAISLTFIVLVTPWAIQQVITSCTGTLVSMRACVVCAQPSYNYKQYSAFDIQVNNVNLYALTFPSYHVIVGTTYDRFYGLLDIIDISIPVTCHLLVVESKISQSFAQILLQSCKHMLQKWTVEGELHVIFGNTLT